MVDEELKDWLTTKEVDSNFGPASYIFSTLTRRANDEARYKVGEDVQSIGLKIAETR